MIIFHGEVFRDVCHGTARFFTPAWQWRILGEADKLVIQANTSEAGGTTPRVILAVEWSNDGVHWTTKMNPIAQFLTAGQNASYFGVDDGTYPSGAYVRLHVEMDGADQVALVQVFVTARMKMPRRQRLAPSSSPVSRGPVVPTVKAKPVLQPALPNASMLRSPRTAKPVMQSPLAADPLIPSVGKPK